MTPDQYPPCKSASVGGGRIQDGICRRASIVREYSRQGVAGHPQGKIGGPDAYASVVYAKFREDTSGIFSGDSKACTKCAELKPATLDFFRSNGCSSSGLAAACRDCDRAKARAWAEANRERSRANSRAARERGPVSAEKKAAWKVEDADAAKARRRERRAMRRAAEGRSITDRLRERIRRAIGARAKGHYSLGCTPAELKRHIERQLSKGMSWANRQDWHVDHIRPLASFDLTDPEQLRAACHFTNLRPLWAADNLRKGANIEVLL